MLVLALIGAVQVAQIGSDFLYVHDSIVYVGGAQGLAEGRGYRFVANVDQPPIAFYPPLQSCYLALWWLLEPSFPANVPALSLGMIMLGLAVCGCFFILLRRGGLPEWLAACCTLLLGTSPTWTDILHSCYSDAFFTLLVFLAALLWERVSGDNSLGNWLAIGAILALAYLTRTQAAAIILAIGAAMAYHALASRQSVPVAARLLPLGVMFLPVACAIGCWRLMAADVPGYGSYFLEQVAAAGGWGGYLRNAAWTSSEYLLGVHFVDGLVPFLVRLPEVAGRWSVASGAVCAILLRLAWVGFIWLALRGYMAARAGRDKVYAWVLAVHMLLIFAWPYPLGHRVLYCTLPFLLRWAYRGFVSLEAVRRAGRKALAVLGAALLALAGTNSYLLWRSSTTAKHTVPQSLADLESLCAWIRREVPRDARLAVDAAVPALHGAAYTGRPFYLVGAPYFPIPPNHDAALRNPPPNAAVYCLIVAKYPDAFPYLTARGLVPKRVARSPAGEFELYQLQWPASRTSTPATAGKEEQTSPTSPVAPLLRSR